MKNEIKLKKKDYFNDNKMTFILNLYNRIDVCV